MTFLSYMHVCTSLSSLDLYPLGGVKVGTKCRKYNCLSFLLKKNSTHVGAYAIDDSYNLSLVFTTANTYRLIPILHSTAGMGMRVAIPLLLIKCVTRRRIQWP